jgi:hypothetical protein
MDTLTDDERELLAAHRRTKTDRTVTVTGHDDKTGSDYEFTVYGDEAERIIARHRTLWEEPGAGGNGGRRAHYTNGGNGK